MTLFFQLIPRYVTVMLYILRNQRLIKMRIDKVAFELYLRILHIDKEGRLTSDQHRNVGSYRKLRGQVAGLSQGRGAVGPPIFGQTVNPVSTRGQIMPTTVLRAPPDFQTMKLISSALQGI